MMQILAANFLKMMNNSGQLKIQEMAFMILAVVLFFCLAGLFVMSIVYMNLHEKANELAQTKTFTSIVSLADSPEFSCVSSKSNCIDGDKVITLINKTEYYNYWPFSSLRVITRNSAFNKSYENMIECNYANYPDCDLITIYDKYVENENAVSSFVAFCRKDYEVKENYEGYSFDRCEIAMIVAGTKLTVPESKKLAG